MSDTQRWMHQFLFEKAAQDAEEARWHARVAEWRRDIASPFRDLHRRWRPAWNAAIESLNVAVGATNQRVECARVAAEHFNGIASMVRELSAIWTAGRAWRTADTIGHVGALEVSEWLFCWVDPIADYPPPVERFSVPYDRLGHADTLKAALVFMRAVLNEPDIVQKLISDLLTREDLKGVSDWVGLIRDVLAPPVADLMVEDWVNGLAIPTGAEPVDVRYVISNVGAYGWMTALCEALERRLLPHLTPAPVKVPGLAEAVAACGEQRRIPLVVSLQWFARLADHETPPYERAAMAWHALDHTLTRSQPPHDLIRYYRAQLRLQQLAVLLVNAGLAQRVHALPDPDIGGRGPAIALLQRAVYIAERYPDQIRVDLELRRLFDGVMIDSESNPLAFPARQILARTLQREILGEDPPVADIDSSAELQAADPDPSANTGQKQEPDSPSAEVITPAAEPCDQPGGIPLPAAVPPHSVERQGGLDPTEPNEVVLQSSGANAIDLEATTENGPGCPYRLEGNLLVVGSGPATDTNFVALSLGERACVECLIQVFHSGKGVLARNSPHPANFRKYITRVKDGLKEKNLPNHIHHPGSSAKGKGGEYRIVADPVP